ncbi:nuclear transport factor 2 family protein [Ketobacter sp.]|uniref:nuclear transport factor 2 family protein n=1 Tax=Ketobacter sp. TaxID=2083498 RepID=UPI000F1D3E90|nr:nuclear transport factor 2 family protein [Ketobacter sp.]RLT92997.1 MAG: nuclear transport factor 2 family protein [Ketobacter sp.]
MNCVTTIVRAGHRILICGLLVTLLSSLLACSPPDSAEQIIAEHIATLETAIEEKDPDPVLALIHDNFSTRTGVDKLWVKRTMAFYMLKHANIAILTSGLHIEVLDDTATARLTAVVSGGQGLIPEQGALYQIETEWRLHEGDWQLIYGDWRRP